MSSRLLIELDIIIEYNVKKRYKGKITVEVDNVLIPRCTTGHFYMTIQLLFRQLEGKNTE